MIRDRIPKGDPRQLRMRAAELKAKAGSLNKEADELEQRAIELEGAKPKREDFSQAAVRIVREATEDK